MDSRKYRALVVKGPNQAALEQRAIPTPAIGQILVRPIAVGICATDLEILAGTIDPAYVRYPIVIGHEWSAMVVEDPSGELKPGTPLVVEGILPCGSCAHCQSGATNLCEIYDELGFTRDGGAAEIAVIPSQLAHPLSKGVDLFTAALVEPAAVAFRGLQRINPRPGMNAVIIGDGTIAMLSALLLQLWTPSKVVMIGRNKDQAELAAKAGVSEFTTDDSRVGSGFDLAIEASGSVEATSAALGYLRRGGALLLLGLPPHGQPSKVPIDDVVNGDISIVGSFSYTASAWRDIVSLLNSAKFNPDFLITHRFSLSQWEAALAALGNKSGPRGKVLLSLTDT